MGLYKLGKIFEPYSIAIIGASERREESVPCWQWQELSWGQTGTRLKIVRVQGYVLSNNRQMLKLGFRVSRNEEARAFHLSIDL